LLPLDEDAGKVSELSSSWISERRVVREGRKEVRNCEALTGVGRPKSAMAAMLAKFWI
jgi:hypothetical protein